MSTLTLTALVADLKASLQDSAVRFTAAADGDFKRHLAMAASDLGRVRPRTLKGSLSLVAGQAAYSAPDDLDTPRHSTWGDQFRAAHKPWDASYPGTPPRLSIAEEGGTFKLWLAPAPTAAQIAAFGSDYPYFYLARHALSDTPGATTVPDADRGLLLLRAQAEAMKELAVRNISKPVQLRDGLQSAPKNGTPAALYAQLMDDFERLAA